MWNEEQWVIGKSEGWAAATCERKVEKKLAKEGSEWADVGQLRRKNNKTVH